MERVRTFPQKNLLEIIQDLEFIRVNLTRIQKMGASEGLEAEKVLLIQGLFLADVEVQQKFTRVWRTLIESFKGEEDALDDMLDTIEHWEIPSHMGVEELLKVWKLKGQKS